MDPEVGTECKNFTKLPFMCYGRFLPPGRCKIMVRSRLTWLALEADMVPMHTYQEPIRRHSGPGLDAALTVGGSFES